MSSDQFKQCADEIKQLIRDIDRVSNAKRDIPYLNITSPQCTNLANTTMLGCQRILQGHQSKIYSIDWMRDSRHLISVSQDSTIRIWDAFESQLIHTLNARSKWLLSTAISPDSKTAAVAGVLKRILIFDVEQRLRTRTSEIDSDRYKLSELSGHSSMCFSIKYMGSNRLISGSADMSCRLWDLNQSCASSTYLGHTGDVLSVTPQNNTDFFISAGSDKTIRLWDTRTSQCQGVFGGHDAPINNVAFLKNNNYVFGSACDDGTCGLFDLRAKQALHFFKPVNVTKRIPFTSISFSQSGRLLFASGNNDQSNGTSSLIFVFDTLKGNCVQTLAGHQHSISSLRTSPDGSCVASASWDNTIRIWA
ncbi:hypothetical protein PCE1_002519 [Barthelona sp. PCE]